MVGNKFFNDISSLNKIELLTFIKYSKSSFLNKNTDITRTIELYRKNKSHFKILLDNDGLMFSKIFSKTKDFDRKILKNHFYSCEKLFEDFVVFHVSQSNKEEKLRILSDFYSKKNIKTKALSTNAKLISIIEKQKESKNKYFNLFNLNLKKFYILLNDFNKDTFQYAKKALNYLDEYYFLEKFYIRQELLSDSIMSSRKYEFSLMNEIKIEIENNPNLSNKLFFKILSINYDLYEKKVDKKTFYILKDLIISNIDSFSKRTQSNFLEDIGNYLSILYSKTGENSLLKEVFINFQTKIEYNTLIVNGGLPDANFSQIIRVSLFLKEYEWVNNFIEEYGILLNNKDLVLLSKAEILMAQKNYDEVFDLINKIDLRTTKLSYELKSLYAKALYDTSKFELLDNHLNTFEIFLRRQKKINEIIIQNNLSFVLYLKRIIKNRISQPKLIKLKAELEEDKKVFNRNWLTIRIENLLK